jgi:DNA-binding IclR family transcriptional regulator
MARGRGEKVGEAGPSRSLDRVGEVLDRITARPGGLSLADLHAATQIPRSSLYILLGSLAAQSIVQRDAAGTYRPGPALVRWAGRILRRLDMQQAALPVMTALAQATGFVANLGRLDAERGEVVFLAKVEAGPFSTTARVGSRMPLHSTALGKVLLAFAPLEVRGRYLATGPLSARTSATITDPERLSAHLDMVRATELAEDREENEPGVAAVAGPVRDWTGHVVAALSVAMPAETDAALRRDVGEQVRRAARRISEELGWEA